MTLVLDAGGVSALADDRDALAELRRRGAWPAIVPVPVLVEVLTGDHRRDFRTNRFLRTCLVRPVDELTAREAARLRTLTGRAGEISAVDALVVAQAATQAAPRILTSDPSDLTALAQHAASPVAVVAV